MKHASEPQAREPDARLIAGLTGYIRGLLSDDHRPELYRQYEETLGQVDPQVVFTVFRQLQADGVATERLLDVLPKVMNVVHAALEGSRIPPIPDHSFLAYLDQENQALLERLDSLRQLIRQAAADPDDQTVFPQMAAAVDDLSPYLSHFNKKENVLFPYLEQVHERYEGLAIMWALHDQARNLLRQIPGYLRDGTVSRGDQFRRIGDLFFVLHGLVQKERLLLFPSALTRLTAEQHRQMLQQSTEYTWAFIDDPRPDQMRSEDQTSAARYPTEAEDWVFQTETGHLTFSQLEQLFETIPVDMTLIDAENRVCFFNRARDRVFPRSPAIIGRRVEFCHPPQSVDKVMTIIDAFRSGQEEKATFWLQLSERFILIQYFALRGRDGLYQGTLEVSQDITEIRTLDGEQRLLDWSAGESASDRSMSEPLSEGM